MIRIETLEELNKAHFQDYPFHESDIQDIRLYALVPDRSCPFSPILETSHSGKSKGWKREELALLCDVLTLGGHRGFEHDCASVLVLHRTHFRNLQNLFVTQGYAFHTYSLKEEREIRVVLKGVSREMPIDEVKEDLRAQNLPVQTVRRILNHFREPLDLVLISGTEANDKATKVAFFQIRSVCSPSGIKAEQPRKRALFGQCHNCQSYRHSSRHCFNPARCVKCLGNHGTAQCTCNKDTDGPPACVLCKQKGHTANYLGCPHAPKRVPPPKEAASRRTQRARSHPR
ncbi:Nucleic-acid-binding protein from transposon X-element [Eumeta japonica]|uniref:Nucleic-acid-binding protein from transposon X-element n=1 Tax=Eumeta variegata TaxID=151549 RepID=A0A4C1X4T9_EUMVA|nr:Nucleic-acid-binding protein from transposon X-element [Eumeta japonica]